MYCGQCGTSNPEEAGHCQTCGAPLLITTGARTCSSCGAAIGDHDRFCTTCGTSASEATPADSYDAADDFGELDIDDIQIDELPDWLQDMAPASGSSPKTAQSGQPSPDDLPDWLRDSPHSERGPGAPAPPPPPPPAQEQQSLSHQPADQFSLVSDDDLPEWLKALSDEDDDTAPALRTPSTERVTREPEPQPTTAVANLYEVPMVSRAWSTQGRTVDQAQVTAARQEFSPLESVAVLATEQTGPQSLWEAGPREPAPDDEQTQPFAVAQDGEEAGRGKMIVRLGILVLLVIVAIILAFVLIQGV